jgi:hypothetical protein
MFATVRACLAVLVLGMGLAGGVMRAQDPDAPPPPPQELQQPPGQEILTGGPMHESFAQPVVYDPKAGPVIDKPPPQPVQELPPDQKPEGPNVQWIPGYWAWDQQRGDYLWISGLWRNIPPGRQWVPGYWHQFDGGFQWAHGAWMPIQPVANQAQYLPAPPASLEAGPNAPAPIADAVWAPGTWIWEGHQYAWRPGFWVAPQPNWIWVPSTYVWSPSGFLYVAGYWDRPFANRGQLFAPVYFSQPLYVQPTFVYQPSIAIVATGLLGGLFIQPSLGVYYFGDYYAPNYFSVGIYPAFAFHQSRFGYDPVFAYYSVTYRRSNPMWVHQQREAYLFRRDHIEARPPSTYREMVQINRTTNITINKTTIINNNARNVTFAAPVSHIARASAAAGSPMRFERVAPAEQQRFAARAAQVHQVSMERGQREAVAAREGVGARPRALEMARSPIAAPHPAAVHNEAVAPHHAPPASPAHPGLERAIQPQAAQQHALRPEPHPDLQHHPSGLQPHMPGSEPRVAPHLEPPRHQPARREVKQDEKRPK